MGYRSNVKIAIYGKTEEVTAFIASEKIGGIPKECDAHPIDGGNDCGKHQNYVYNKDYTMLLYEWEHVKWYTGYADVNYWNTLITSWEETYGKGSSMCVEYARIGENYDDLETITLGNDIQYYIELVSYIGDNLPTADAGDLNDMMKEKNNESRD